MANDEAQDRLPAGDPAFHATHWSVVLQAASGDSTAALERLWRAYWYPLYHRVLSNAGSLYLPPDRGRSPLRSAGRLAKP